MKTSDEAVLRPGELVQNKSFGLGKVLAADATTVYVYFKEREGETPEARVAKFTIPSPFLQRVDGIADLELDNLPPWKGDRFDRPSTPVTVHAAIARFLSLFPAGLDDPVFQQRERRYKEAAHKRWVSIRPSLDNMIQRRDSEAIAAAIDAVYGDQRVPKNSTEERLNLLFQRIEEPAYFGALRAGGAATVDYLDSAITFIEAPSSSTAFAAYRDALMNLPTRAGGAQLDHWTTLTWLPFIADPVNHMLVKPTIVRSFASAIGFEIDYRPDLNFATYSKCVAFGRRLQVILENSSVNVRQRALDLLDVQSFMWVVQRWTDEDKASSTGSAKIDESGEP